MRTIKAEHVATCQSILIAINGFKLADRLNYQDKTLNMTLKSLLKLLNLSATRFSSQFFIENLLNQSKISPFFKIKVPILNCLIAIAQNKMTLGTIQQF
jgi:hypothetical protein